MGKKRNLKYKRIITEASLKDLAFSSGWFMACFLQNVLRVLKLSPKIMESYPEKQQLRMMWEQVQSDEDGSPIEETRVQAGCDIQYNVKGDCSVLQWFGNSVQMKDDIKQIWNKCIKQLDDAWKKVRGT